MSEQRMIVQSIGCVLYTQISFHPMIAAAVSHISFVRAKLVPPRAHTQHNRTHHIIFTLVCLRFAGPSSPLLLVYCWCLFYHIVLILFWIRVKLGECVVCACYYRSYSLSLTFWFCFPFRFVGSVFFLAHFLSVVRKTVQHSTESPSSSSSTTSAAVIWTWCVFFFSRVIQKKRVWAHKIYCC